MNSDGHLVVITGPIASGKSTAAEGLAGVARANGRTAATVDMDDLVTMVVGNDWSDVTEEHWRQARRLAARLCDSLLEDGTHIVALSGPFLTTASRHDLISQLTRSREPLFVMLHVSLEESLRRIEAHPGHLFYQDAATVQDLYGSIDWTQQPETDLVVETDGLSTDKVLENMAIRLAALA